MNKDYYEILGVSKDSTQKEIKSSFRALAKKYHPDISKEENAEEKFKEIQEAYDVLSNEEKRSNYDRFGHDTYKQSYSNAGYNSSYNYYEYYNPNTTFVNFNLKDWYSKKSFFEKIIYAVLGILLLMIGIFLALFVAIVALVFFAVYVIVKMIIMLVKIMSGER